MEELFCWFESVPMKSSKIFKDHRALQARRLVWCLAKEGKMQDKQEMKVLKRIDGVSCAGWLGIGIARGTA